MRKFDKSKLRKSKRNLQPIEIVMVMREVVENLHYTQNLAYKHNMTVKLLSDMTDEAKVFCDGRVPIYFGSKNESYFENEFDYGFNTLDKLKYIDVIDEEILNDDHILQIHVGKAERTASLRRTCK